MKNTPVPKLVIAFIALFAFALIMGPSVEAQGFNPDRPAFHPKAPSHWPDDDSSDDGSSDDDSSDDGECVVVCHKPGTSAEQTLCVDPPAVHAHLGHGDYLGECEGGPPTGDTILNRLIRTDGTQALVASVLVVDEALETGIADLLNDPYANLILFAPGNAAFEKLLGLEPGSLDGLSIGTIAALLPGILEDLGLSAETVRDVLLKHVAVNQGFPESGSEDGLLERGSVMVADESVFPISIGPRSVAINYESGFTKPDVFTENGVIHYLDTVILDAGPTIDPPDVNEACSQGACEADPDLAEECDEFLDVCLPNEPEEDCIAAALLICREI